MKLMDENLRRVKALTRAVFCRRVTRQLHYHQRTATPGAASANRQAVAPAPVPAPLPRPRWSPSPFEEALTIATNLAVLTNTVVG